MTAITISLDAMGGDHAPDVVVAAVARAIATQDNCHFILVGDETELTRRVSALKKTDRSRLTIHPASQVVTMEDSPSLALRQKKDSSMRVAINLVKSGDAAACVSAGNTGALMATSRFVLKMLHGIDRPAIMSSFPTLIPNQPVQMLDLGADVDSSVDNLFQFAVMASVYSKMVCAIERPRVALLNIGGEAIKGNQQVKQAGERFSETDKINYIGYVEGDQIFSGDADIIVCDGFVGNVALKAIEGTTRMVGKLARQTFSKNWYHKLAALLALPAFKDIKATINPADYNGAALMGLRGIVIKSHGSAQVPAYYSAIVRAIQQAKANIPERIQEQLVHILNVSESS